MTHDCPHKRVRGLDTPEQKWQREGMNGSSVRARVRSLGCRGPDVRAPGGLLAQRQEAQKDEPGRVHTVLCVSVFIVLLLGY